MLSPESILTIKNIIEHDPSATTAEKKQLSLILTTRNSLISTQEASELLGVSVRTFERRRKLWGYLQPQNQSFDGKTNYYLQDDVLKEKVRLSV